MAGLIPHIQATGIVCPVGLSSSAACAAIRAGISGVGETRFRAGPREWLRGASAPLPGLSGARKLVAMASLAAEESLKSIAREERRVCPVLLCLPDSGRAAALGGLDGAIFDSLAGSLEVGADADGCGSIWKGRVGVAFALREARRLMAERAAQRVLVVGVDSLLNRRDVERYLRAGRLVTSTNSNGFFPGEGAAALLVGVQPADGPAVRCIGSGIAREKATIESEEVLRGDGLCAAVRAALAEGGLRFADVEWRLADLTGEHYYFKEAALLVSRLGREPIDEQPLWHPAECVGETGAAAGALMLALCAEAFRSGRAPGAIALCHLADDDGSRAAVLVEKGEG